MKVFLNGEQRDLPDGASVSALVKLLTDAPGGRGIAVAVGGEVVPRGQWEARMLAEGARVEVVGAVQGG
jgi:sulfur carrier protein